MHFIKKLKYIFYNPVIKAYYDLNVLTLEYLNGKIEHYKGSCTVWYNGIYRCSTSKEFELSGYWEYCKNGKIWTK